MVRRAKLWLAGQWLAWAGNRRRLVALDLLLLAFAAYIGYALRLTLFLEPRYLADCALAALLFSLSIAASLWIGGLYRVLWPQASVEEYLRLARWYLPGLLLFWVVTALPEWLIVPRTSLAIMAISGLMLLAALRVSWRLCRMAPVAPSGAKRRRALVVGAGEAGTLLARDVQRNDGDLELAGFVDDDPAKRGMQIAGLTVLGMVAELPGLIDRNGVEVVLVAIPSAAGRLLRGLLDRLAEEGVEVRVLPSLHELAGRGVSMNRLRNVRLEDLLGREPVELDMGGIGALLRGRRVLVTGAGGSIGSEICRQVLEYAPSDVVALGHGEHSLYRLLEGCTEHPVIPVVADVADAPSMERVFAKYTPDIVFHAAAHKHVPLMESNAREALRVNAHGTATVARLAGEQGCSRMVMISTDKAVNPANVMGATKRLAELVLQEQQRVFPETAYAAVRFGNVLGSRGSVVPKFEEQIASGGPVTVTHPEMRRYFMLIPEAVSLVLQSAALGRGGELFVLDMGEPVRIVELAEMLIRLHGYTPGKDIQIAFTGKRPGEKLFEELFYDPDCVDRTAHEKIFLSRNEGVAVESVGAAIADLLNEEDDAGLMETLQRVMV
ncbi:MAG: polysaccharide biosynthesis protein [Synergistales bacterium]|nr:polysaccharide biosynthesis protein [Synergistales bacterium]